MLIRAAPRVPFGAQSLRIRSHIHFGYRRSKVNTQGSDEPRAVVHKLTAEVSEQAQRLLNEGLEVPEVGRRVGILANTLHKAIRDGRLTHNIKKKYFYPR
jgi:hypothetical protein